MSSGKEQNIEESPASPSAYWTTPNGRARDDALDYLEKHKDDTNASLGLDPVYMRRLRRKIDFYVIPFLLLCYIMNFLDKILLNVGWPCIVRD